MHVEGVGLAIAMESGRIYLPSYKHPWNNDRPPNWVDGQYPKSLCGEKQYSYCYYLEWSNCTWEHVNNQINKSKQKDVQVMTISKQHTAIHRSTGYFPKGAFSKYDDQPVMSIMLPDWFHYENIQKMVPSEFYHMNVLRNLIPKKLHYYYWRGVSVAYLFTPNQLTRELIRNYSVASHDSNDQSCISFYIRHGDKAKEMKLQSFEVYGDLSKDIRSQFFQNNLNKTIIFGTETPETLETGLQWGIKNEWKMVFNPLQLDIFRSKGTDISKFLPYLISIDSNMSGKNLDSKQRSISVRKLGYDDIPTWEKYFYLGFYELEYASMIINLHDLMSCSGFVCTLASNYCRLLDEFRTFVAGKGNLPFADISPETCSKVPCLNSKNIINLSW